jgi:prepilin-type N-terminal cleavage/methylation domain-containing protein/prepilin-type processing-associated H-X9-DG protein
MRNRQSWRNGFTLVELLVVIALIGLLMALLVPAIMQARSSARTVHCTDKLRQIGLALYNYQSNFKLFPPGGVHMTTARPGTVPTGNQNTDGRAPWTVLILSELDETARYNAFNFEAPFSARADLTSMTPEPNLTEQYRPINRYQCPNDPTDANGLCSNYAACQGGGTPDDAAAKSAQVPGQLPRLFFDNGIFFHNSSVSLADITDGSSNTVLVGETKYIGTASTFAPTKAWWPWSAAIRADNAQKHAALFNISATCDPINFPQNGEYTEEDIRKHLGVFEGANHGGQQRVYGSWHAGGANFLMADGSVHFLGENMDLNVYRSLGRRADGGPSSF